MTPTIRSKMFLSILAVSILLISVGCSSATVLGHISLPCCFNGMEKVEGTIVGCFEQKRTPLCRRHFYLVATEGRPPLCVKPDSTWLQDKIHKEHLKCPLAYKH